MLFGCQGAVYKGLLSHNLLYTVFPPAATWNTDKIRHNSHRLPPLSSVVFHSVPALSSVSPLYQLYAFLYFSLKTFFIAFCKYVPDPGFYIRCFGFTEPDRNHCPVYIQPENRGCAFLASVHFRPSFPMIRHTYLIRRIFPITGSSFSCPLSTFMIPITANTGKTNAAAPMILTIK